MKNDVHGTSFRSARIVIAMALVAMMLVGGGTALAGGNQADGSAALARGDTADGSAALAGGKRRSVFVSGNSTASDCGRPGSDYALKLTGDLRGCWSGFIRGVRCLSLDGYDLYFEKGREIFIGKFHGKRGAFTTTYTFDGVYAKGFCQSFDPTLEVAGGCIHPIKAGNRVFAKVGGVIKFLDVIAGVTGDPSTGEFQAGTGANNFVYYGRLNFDRSRQTSAQTSRSLSRDRLGDASASGRVLDVSRAVQNRAGGCGGGGVQ